MTIIFHSPAINAFSSCYPQLKYVVTYLILLEAGEQSYHILLQHFLPSWCYGDIGDTGDIGDIGDIGNIGNIGNIDDPLIWYVEIYWLLVYEH